MQSFLLIIGLFLMGIAAKGPRFRYLDKTVPVYLHVKSLPDDTDDVVSKYIKDSLLQLNFKFSSSVENSTRSKQFFDEVKSNIQSFTAADFKKGNTFERAINSSSTSMQSLTIFYSSEAEKTCDFETCDSAGFIHFKVPPFNFTRTRLAFPMKEIGSRMPDSIARFLMKKM